MNIEVKPSGQACGASISGVDLTEELSFGQVAQIREAWLEHKVLSFSEQPMSDDDLERFTLYFGRFGDDPYIAPIVGRKHIIAVQRRAQETTRLFAENWHTDWSFQENPPVGTCLFGITIPPRGGDTLFVNQEKAWRNMPEQMRAKYRDLIAIHSAKKAYAPGGTYGRRDQVVGRSMDIRASEDAELIQTHPLILTHPETAKEVIYSCLGYIIGFQGKSEEEASLLLSDLLKWQGREEFVYTLKWRSKMLVMWDNRSVLHRATGGYEGFDRLLHRTTISAF
ncbi:MAG: TauD/TfdA family dioxygenase [Gammaproteobacteria bacterium]|nr:TauD/TfdA family dioxygenase [Gammaproteobacteria bacterium]